MTVARHRLAEARHGVGGICWAGDRYVVAGRVLAKLRNAPDAGVDVHEYDGAFRWLRTVRLPGDWTGADIKTAEFAYGRFFFGCRGEPPCVLVASPDLRHVERLAGAEAACGIARGPGGKLLLGWDRAGSDGHHGKLWVVEPSRFWNGN